MKVKRRRPPTASRAEGNAILRDWCGQVVGRVLSVGSGADIDREGGHYRDYFRLATTYETSDVKPGCGLVIDVQAMAGVRDQAYDAIFCHSVLEHVPDPWSAVREMTRALAPGGLLLLGVPFNYKIHRAPTDYWRFTEYGVRLLLEHGGLSVVHLVGVDGPSNHAALYWAFARKPW